MVFFFFLGHAVLGLAGNEYDKIAAASHAIGWRRLNEAGANWYIH